MAQHRWDTVDSQDADGPGPWDRDLEEPRRRWAFSLPAAVLAVCMMLGCGLAILVLRDREPVPVASVGMSPPGTAPSPLPEAGSSNTVTPSTVPSAASAQVPSGAAEPKAGTAMIMVHVAGAVQHPGVVRLDPGSRIVDAVEAAGGTAPDADLARVNLAAVAEDGVMVLVPRIDESASGLEAGSPGGNPAGGSPPAADGTGAASGSVNLNTADSAQLQTLPRVGPVLAERIMAWRTEHGRFSRPEDLDAIPGIGKAMMAALLPLVMV
ncbi:helix-hairpin-helix domain-containing protein [Arthrobacter sp. zg-Y238]|uniref:helix-hairpin-helix domain-containing protein n=1 Tax=Arthrobacter sp. zg-Y238 TaxID=2964614 RepID=UPI002101FF07|nr:helix-hairpin-helix domain-containing protein [Arthrobacter sp. zg-Y238]MCQ1953311.1 helix-hairpin-helix domain-containing protein [Arthrobacter sp. zg-Y238]